MVERSGYLPAQAVVTVRKGVPANVEIVLTPAR
jgi:hypothetical protein